MPMIDTSRKRFIEAKAWECRPRARFGLENPFCLARDQKCYLFRYPIGEDPGVHAETQGGGSDIH